MKENFKNPHTFDMSNYFSGLTYVLGGRDFRREETEGFSDKEAQGLIKKDQIKLDWSFLKNVNGKDPKVK